MLHYHHVKYVVSYIFTACPHLKLYTAQYWYSNSLRFMSVNTDIHSLCHDLTMLHR